jgi:UDP-4-amino-4,6-dideoxy-N-acetyl-beta-L-altrosamine N-acetyltransferase
MEQVRKDLVIKGEQIYLRPITVEDTDLAVKWRNKKAVVDNFIYRKPVTRQDHLNWLENKVFKGLVHQFIICRNTDGFPMGSIYLQNFEEENKKAEWGIYIGEEQAYGKGVGTEAARLVLKYAFEDLGMHKVVSRVLAFNKASIRMNEKAGYVREAYLKDELFIDGKYEDLVLFGAINGQQGE